MAEHGFSNSVTVPLDDKVWQAWVAKNRENEKLGILKRRTLATLIGATVVAAGMFWVFARLA
jgi:hypothetical protein